MDQMIAIGGHIVIIADRGVISIGHSNPWQAIVAVSSTVP
jgi:hypothetical protein